VNGSNGVKVNCMKLPVPGTKVMVTIAGEGLSLSDGIEAVSELLKHMKKGAAQGWDGKTLEKVCKDEWKRQGRSCGNPRGAGDSPDKDRGIES
jgi:hypothetical protein